MAALQDYARLGVFYNQVWLEQITSASMTTNSGNQRVDLLNEGLGGFSDGSGDVTIEIGFAMPVGGTEVPVQEDCANKSFVDLQFERGGKSYIGRGKVESESVSQSVNAAVEGTFTWIGEIKPIE